MTTDKLSKFCKDCRNWLDDELVEDGAVRCDPCDENFIEKQAKQAKLAAEKLGELAVKVIGYQLACADYNIDPPAFRLGCAGYAIMVLSGRNSEVNEIFQDWIDTVVPLLEVAQAKHDDKT